MINAEPSPATGTHRGPTATPGAAATPLSLTAHLISAEGRGVPNGTRKPCRLQRPYFANSRATPHHQLRWRRHHHPACPSTAHVIADRLADSNGTYVALTRARERTHLYASTERLEPADEGGDGGRGQQLASLAGQLGRSEPELSSISIALAHERQAEHEHADESESATVGSGQREQLDRARAQRDQALVELEQARVRLERARVEQREVAAVMASEPRDQRAEHAHADARRAGEQAQWAAARGEQLEGERAGLGRLARLGERGRALRGEITAARARERDGLAEQRRCSQEADARDAELHEQRREWEARHPGARERHHGAEREHGRAEQAHQVAEARYEIAVVRELRAASFPQAVAPERLQQLRQEQARLQALGERADQARLAEVRAELGRLTPGSSAPSRAVLGHRPGFGPERRGPTIGR